MICSFDLRLASFLAAREGGKFGGRFGKSAYAKADGQFQRGYSMIGQVESLRTWIPMSSRPKSRDPHKGVYARLRRAMQPQPIERARRMGPCVRRHDLGDVVDEPKTNALSFAVLTIML
jgi:hypothetical protein